MSCRRALARCLAACLLVAGIALPMAPGGALAEDEAPAAASGPPRVLRVATGPVAPFVLERDGLWSGFSIELWHAIAQRLHVHSEFVDLGSRSPAAQIAALLGGRADVATSNIIITAARERMVDFTLPFHEGGLQILVPAERSSRVLGTIIDVVSPALMETALVGLVLAILLAHVVWLVERRINPKMPGGYLRGIGDGLWGAMLIVATGEHGDRDTPSVAKRITVAGMWLLGVVLVAQFTATMTSSLTVQRLRTDIRGPSDLAGKALGTVPGSVAADWLERRGLPYMPVPSPEQGLAMLANGEVQAIVYNAATVQYWATHLGGGRVEVTGPVFHPERYAIALPLGSPLRKEINAALLELIDNGTWEEMRRRWLGDVK